MKSSWLLPLVPILLLAACSTDVRVDPHGHLCDPGEVCPDGFTCVQGVCRGNDRLCEGVTCATPANSCKDASTLLAHEAGATCDASTGSCVFAPTEIPCAQGCVDGRCVGEPCAGVTCASPPGPVCLDGDTLRTFGASGTCSGEGACDYPATEITCASGCVDGQCVGEDACAAVSCNTPPPPQCVGSKLRTFSASGTCDPTNGSCAYPETITECPNGCIGGACAAVPKTFTQIGPELPGNILAADVAPGSHGKHVLVVGERGFAAKWDGVSWTPVSTGTNDDLLAVWLRSDSRGWVAGEHGTLLSWDGAAFSPVNLFGSFGDFVAVHGDGDHVLVAARDGSTWRSTDGVSFARAAQPPLTNYYTVHDAFVEPDGSERLVGSCAQATGSQGCVLYSEPGYTQWFVDKPMGFSGPGMYAVGPSVSGDDRAFVAQGLDVRRHSDTGSFDAAQTPSGLAGDRVIGISRDLVAGGGRASFLLTAASSSAFGRLYRYGESGGVSELLQLYHVHQALSKNESGGVIVVDGRPGAANVLRRGPATNEALALAEDWVAVAGDPQGRRVLVNPYGDFALRRPGASTWVLERSPLASADIRGVVLDASGLVLFGDAGAVYRWTPPPGGGYQPVSGAGSTTLHAGCRLSDTEVILVGSGGRIFSFDGATLSSKPSPVSNTLRGVACAAPGRAVAVGSGGAVVTLNNGAWTAISAAFPDPGAELRSAWIASNGEVFVAGDGVFAKFSGGAWIPLEAQADLDHLAGFGPGDIYATSFEDVVRFDGANWSRVFTAPDLLRGGGVVNGRAVYVGDLGLVVESN